MPSARNRELIELGDLDELVRQIDRLVDARHWDGLIDLHDRARQALDRGKQLWPVASLAEYRLALEAPGEWAAQVLTDAHGRFALGPLPEVAASTHTWADLVPHLVPGPAAVMFAHERVVRGDDLTGIELPGPPVLDLPLRLAAWEPAYPVATYEPAKADFPAPDVPEPATQPVRGGQRYDAEVVDDGEVVDALRGLARTWTTESDGRADATAVTGDALTAVRTLGPPSIRIVEIAAADAMAAMAWTAASGGAHGRRRGMAAGRFEAWWTAAALCGFDPHAAVSDNELGEAVAELRWYRWDAAEPSTGWELRLAVEDPSEGLAWAVAATDAVI